MHAHTHIPPRFPDEMCPGVSPYYELPGFVEPWFGLQTKQTADAIVAQRLNVIL